LKEDQIVRGADGARPELRDALDVLILLDTPPEQRRRQLLHCCSRS
jgi:hypothetical protein